jgi:hypothetical protein
MVRDWVLIGYPLTAEGSHFNFAPKGLWGDGLMGDQGYGAAS